jgi:4-hydroxy-L-threonine phosphate dehydrogenase PdxA
MTASPLRLALTPGAEHGIGPELLVKAVSTFLPSNNVIFLWCGDEASLALACARARVQVRCEKLSAQFSNGLRLEFFPDFAESDGEKRQALFLDKSVLLARANLIDALVTGPIEKGALKWVMDGPFPGQTEYFAHHLGSTDKPFMAFMGGPFVLSLLTTHMPLRLVADAITEQLIVDHLMSVAKNVGRLKGALARDVKITILGLNPHAGEQGLLGHEEQTIFAKALTRAKHAGLDVEGPLAADGFFGYFGSRMRKPDVVVAAYHDQGLAAYKILAHGNAVNITLGLTHVRSSPAHGTAPELVGTARADHSSTVAAINTAIEVANIIRSRALTTAC